MNPILSRTLIVAVSAAAVFYIGLQGLRRALDGNYLGYHNHSLDEARAGDLLLGEYVARCETGDAASAFVARPTKKRLGVLLVGTRIVVPDAVVVSVSETPDGVRFPQIEFEDGAGVRLDPDGRSDEYQVMPADPETSDLGTCCFSYRSRIPERFWLTDRDGKRLCEFTFDESTRRDVPPQTRWAW